MPTLAEFARLMSGRIEFLQVPDLIDSEINKEIISLLKEIEITLITWRGLNSNGDDFFDLDVLDLHPVKMSSVKAFREDIFVVRDSLENYPLLGTVAEKKVAQEYKNLILLNLSLILRLLSLQD